VRHGTWGKVALGVTFVAMPIHGGCRVCVAVGPRRSHRDVGGDGSSSPSGETRLRRPSLPPSLGVRHGVSTGVEDGYRQPGTGPKYVKVRIVFRGLSKPHRTV
jgi:hypothetical protein